jgi:hypothetical protein
MAGPSTTTHNTARLKIDQGESGWISRSVSAREAVLYKDDRTEVLEIPPPIDAAT